MKHSLSQPPPRVSLLRLTPTTRIVLGRLALSVPHIPILPTRPSAHTHMFRLREFIHFKALASDMYRVL